MDRQVILMRQVLCIIVVFTGLSRHSSGQCPTFTNQLNMYEGKAPFDRYVKVRTVPSGGGCVPADVELYMSQDDMSRGI